MIIIPSAACAARTPGAAPRAHYFRNFVSSYHALSKRMFSPHEISDCNSFLFILLYSPTVPYFLSSPMFSLMVVVGVAAHAHGARLPAAAAHHNGGGLTGHATVRHRGSPVCTRNRTRGTCVARQRRWVVVRMPVERPIVPRILLVHERVQVCFKLSRVLVVLNTARAFLRTLLVPRGWSHMDTFDLLCVLSMS